MRVHLLATSMVQEFTVMKDDLEMVRGERT